MQAFFFFAKNVGLSHNKRSMSRGSHPYVIISARPASADLHVTTQLLIRISHLWRVAGTKYQRSFMMNLFLACAPSIT